MSRISCIIPTHNNAAEVKPRLEQLSPYVDEMIVAHDGCPVDNTRDLALEYGAAYIQTPFYSWCEPVLKNALLRATGNWVLICSDDEEYLPVFLTHMRHYINHADRIGGDGYSCKRLEKTGAITMPVYFFRRIGKWYTDVIHTEVQGCQQLLQTGNTVDLLHRSKADWPGGDPALFRSKVARYNGIIKYQQGRYANNPEILRHLEKHAGRLGVEYNEPVEAVRQRLLQTFGT